MDTSKYVNIIDGLDHARQRLSFLSCMFVAVKAEAFEITNAGLAGLCQTLWSIEDLVDKAREFMDQHEESSFLSKLKERYELIQGGALGLNGSLAEIKRTAEEIDRYMDNNFREILNIRAKLEEAGEGIARQLMGRSEQNSSGENRKAA